MSNITSPLHQAVFEEKIETVGNLLAEGARVDSKDCKEDTPLHIAAQAGSEKIFKLLLDARANVNLKNNIGSDASALLSKE